MSELIFQEFAAGYSPGVMAVSGVSMRITGGSVTAVIGPNGSGKSTLLKGIMSFPGIHSRGSVTLDSSPVQSMNRSERAGRIAYLPQSPPVPAGLTAIETVLLGRFPHRSAWSSDTAEDTRIALDALDMVGASHLADKFTDEISGGENRLVNLAAVLSQKTEVILLDEPGSSLDYGHAAQLWKLLSDLADRGIVILATTHRIEMSGNAFDKVLLLSEGKALAFGNPEDVFLSKDLLSRVYKTPMKVRQSSPGSSWIVFPGSSE
ncbi:MAG: ABC transporter ATP-binding protein [Candidatus Sabulitectum sp.]|nr:ABC transporter ATP-binding protein [Candidatus Sabulitectum sp.]